MKNQIKYIYILLVGIIIAQGSYQILTIPSNTRMLSLSNSSSAMDDVVNSHNPASINTLGKKNISFHSHLYPADILYLNTEAIIPFKNYIFSFNYVNLNYGEFKDGETNYLFNSSEFLFKSSIKTKIFDRISFGSSLAYGINKISNEFSQAIFLSLGVRTQLENPRLGIGLSINNLGKILQSFSDVNEELPTSLNISSFYSPKYFPGFLFLDISKSYHLDILQVNAGVEVEFTEYLFFRLGNSSNAFDLSDSYSSYFPGLSTGIGIKSKKWDIDIGVFNLETAGIVTGISLLYKK
tara:strand:+ start:588 stop:1472 length:885 start_codon:yes stop_codon:yes gene_type:complete